MKKTIFIILSLFLFSNSSVLAQEYRIVERVLDGDTVILDKEETIRLIGVDTPELHHAEKPVMYYAEEAYKFTKNLCEGKKVKIEYDEVNIPNKHKDKYGRTLAYLYLGDGTFINAEIIKQGYGFCYYKFPFKYLEEFRQCQRNAMEENKGLWIETIHNPETSNIIMLYEKLDAEGKGMAKNYLEYLTIKHRKGD